MIKSTHQKIIYHLKVGDIDKNRFNVGQKNSIKLQFFFLLFFDSMKSAVNMSELEMCGVPPVEID